MIKDSFNPDPVDQLSLSNRYLFWLYKTTRDELDKIDRKFTQLDIDNVLHREMNNGMKGIKGSVLDGMKVLLREWQEYIFQKDSDAKKLKYAADGQLNHTYLFLRLKLRAVEALTRRYFGKRRLSFYKKLYEDMAIEMILQDHSGRR